MKRLNEVQNANEVGRYMEENRGERSQENEGIEGNAICQRSYENEGS